MSGQWTVVLSADWYAPHLRNMLAAYSGSGEQNECRDEMVAQIDAQLVGDGVDRTTRPLVVIDPENREQVERLLTLYLTEYDGTASKPQNGEVSSMQAALRSLVADPKPEEPQGLGAVVEASCVHNDERRTWVRDHSGNWQPETGGGDDYGSLRAVEVKCEGWSE